MVIKTKLYGGNVELMFDSFRHKYTKEGKPVISVTTALSIINKPALISWASNMAIEYVSSQIEPGKSYDEMQLAAIWEGGKKAHYQRKVDAGTQGTFLHKWIEAYIKGEQPTMPVNEGLKKGAETFLGWVEKHQVEFILSEQQIYSRKYNFTGTLDFICKIDGKMYIGDLKTSSGIYPEMFVQTAAYRAAREEEYEDEKYDGQLILRIGKKGDFEVGICTDWDSYRKMFVAFIAAHKLHQTMELLKEFKPERQAKHEVGDNEK